MFRRFGFDGFGGSRTHNSVAPRFPALAWTPRFILFTRTGTTAFNKNAGDSWDNASVYSAETLATNVEVEFAAGNHFIAGFSATPGSVAGHSNVEIALFTHANGNVYVAIGNVTQFLSGTWVEGDILRYRYTRATGTVEVFKNNVLIDTQAGLFAANQTLGLSAMGYYSTSRLLISNFGTV